MDKMGISRMSKTIILAQLAIVVGALMFVILFAPKTIYPLNNGYYDDSVINFNFRNANIIVVDEDPMFSSPQEIDIREVNITKIRFPPGKYYWKAIGILESPVKSFTINSKVGLEYKEQNSSIVNVGNVKINVSEENSKGISGLAIVDIGIEYPVDPKEDTLYRGEEYEN
jgi:hypothetical protein